MQSKSADVFGRSWVVYQWLSVKHIIDPNYQNLLLPSFFEFRDLLDSATKNFLSENLKTFDDKNMKTANNIKDDIVSIRATTNSYMQINHELSENNYEVNNNDTTNFAFKHCYLANSTKKTLYNTGNDTTHTYFINAAKTIGLNVDADKEEYDKTKSF